MWPTSTLLLLAGITFASSENGWKDGKEYTYKITSRTLAELNPQLKQYTGILMEARLVIQSSGQDTLRAKIIESRYSPIHTHYIDKGWDAEISHDQVNLRNLSISDEAFEIQMKNGIVRDIVVNKNVSTWEVNILKGIVNQIQVDIHGENIINSMHNQTSENKQLFFTFKSMETSVSGKCEVVYDVSSLPENILENDPELVPMPELREDGDIISLVKNKNYSNCDIKVGYHYGLNGRNKFEPGSNDKGRLLTRSSVSQIIISGNFEKYTIQSSVTINKLILNPDQQENQEGMIASMTKLTLCGLKDISEPLSPISHPHSTGNLIFDISSPLGKAETRQPEGRNGKPMNESQNNKYNSDESKINSKFNFSDEEDKLKRPLPKLTETPETFFSDFFKDDCKNQNPNKNKQDLVNSVKNITLQIGIELQTPSIMLEEQTLEKFTILTKLIRSMNPEQINGVYREIYAQSQSLNLLNLDDRRENILKNAWVAFRDAVAQAGTGPALLNIKQWIKNKKIQDEEAAAVIDTVTKSVRIPTIEYIDTLFDIMTMNEVYIDQPDFSDTALLSFADLVRHAMVNAKSAHSRYPVYAFRGLVSEDKKKYLEKYLNWMERELEDGVDRADNIKIHSYISALGRTADPRILSIFEPYIEGKKQVSPFQRLYMVMNLDKLAEIKPKTAQTVLYRIFTNNAENHKIRSAAVYLLMKTKPSASMLQRMADYTNYNINKHVKSAVKSSIESISQLQGIEVHGIVDAAQSAIPFLTSKKYGLQYSRAVFKRNRDPLTHTGFNLQANYIGGDDSIIPQATTISINPVFKGLELTKLKFESATSSVQDFWEFTLQQLTGPQEDSFSKKAREKKFSPENIAKVLEIYGKQPEQIEAIMTFDNMKRSFFWSLNNHTLKQFPRRFRTFVKSMKKGTNVNITKMMDYEVTMQFPMESGLPVTFNLKSPTVFSLKGHATANTESDSDDKSPLPKAAVLTGKAQIVLGLNIQKRLFFTTPFEGQEYMIGKDKNLQILLPIRGEVEYDVDRKEARMKIQVDDENQEYKVLQFEKQSFTTRQDVTSLQPVTKINSTHVTHKHNVTNFQTNAKDWGDKQSLQFQWKTSSMSGKNESYKSMYQRVLEATRRMAQSIVTIVYPNEPETVEYEKLSVTLYPSSGIAAEMKISYDSIAGIDNELQDSGDSPSKAKVHFLEKNLNQHERKQKFLKQASREINSVKAKAIDISLKLIGRMESSLNITAAAGISEADERSRTLLYATARMNDSQSYFLTFGMEAKNPNVETLDYKNTLDANTPREYDVEILYGLNDGKNDTNMNKIEIKGKMRQSEDRKNQIRQSRDAQICNEDKISTGNIMTSVCQKVNRRAALVDEGEYSIICKNENLLKHELMNIVNPPGKIFQKQFEFQKNENGIVESDRMKVIVQLASNNETIDVSFKTFEGEVQSKNIEFGSDDYMNDGQQNDEEYLSSWMTQYTTCSLDKTQVKTFDQNHYSVQLGKCWHAVMTSYPKNDPDIPSKKKEIPYNMLVSILARENEDGRKEIKITIGDREVFLLTSDLHQTQAKVNGNDTCYSKNKSHQEKENGKVIFELYRLADNSTKLVSEMYNLKITYDGFRAKIEAGERYRDSVRGLCGDNDAEPENDQISPKGCLLQQPEEFAATYALVESEQCEGPARQNAAKAKESPCADQTVRPGNVISEKEAGREITQNSQNEKDDAYEDLLCTRYRTLVNMSETQICFSTRPISVCSSSCSPKSVITRSIYFHCVDRTSAAEKVAEQIEQGADPELSVGKITKTEDRAIPFGCKP